MSKVWFSADAHYGHKRIIEYCDRPFESVEEMDRALIKNWNDVVQPEDDVYFLGDFTLNFKYVKEVVPLLQGNIHLVAGNHDLCHSCNSDSGAYMRRYLEAGFSDICERTRLSIGGHDVLCCHLPYFNAEDIDQRYPEYKPDDDGGWLLHGHVHHRWKLNGRQLNVGVDVWDFSPVSLDAIAALIEEETLKLA